MLILFNSKSSLSILYISFYFQLSECKVVKEILATTNTIKCMYQDIIYLSDAKYTIGASKAVYGDQTYVLKASDHVKVTCMGQRLNE